MDRARITKTKKPKEKTMIKPVVLDLYNVSIEKISEYLADSDAPDEVFIALGAVMGMVEIQQNYIKDHDE